MLDQAYQPPAAPPTTIRNVILANLAVPIALVALPVFLATGKPFNAWAIATGLWLVNRLLQAGVNRFIIGLPQTIAVGHRRRHLHLAGLGHAARPRADRALRREGTVALPAAILFAVLYTVRPHRPRHLLRQQPTHARGEAPVTLLRRARRSSRFPLAIALAAPALALAEPKVDPTKEFLLHPYVEIKPFPWLDLSITKAVLYLMLRGRRRGRRTDPGHPRRPAPEARSLAGGRRARLQLRRDLDRSGHAAREAVQDVVPVPRGAVHVHLGLEPHLVHPAAVRHRAQVARDPRLHAVRRHREPVGDARADARDVLRARTSSASSPTAPATTSRRWCG